VAPVNPAVPVPADTETLSTTTTGYDQIDTTNDPDTWKLGLPTRQTTVVDGGSADITRITRYDAEGRIVQVRQPKSTGSDAGTTNTSYYTGSGTYNPTTAPCDGKPEWAGLVCKVTPAAAADTGPTLPSAATTKYSALLQPATVVETSGSSTRTTSTTYLPDGRVETATVSSSGITGSTSVPAVTTSYDSATGLPVKVSTTSTEYTQTGYDAWGRATSYRNSLGETTTTSYVATGSDGASSVSVVTDPKGTTTYGYGTDANGAAERRGMPTSVAVSGAGTFTGAYDAGGSLVTQKYPAGIVQTTTLDTAGEPVGLQYAGDVTSGGSTSTDTWMAWAQANDIAGRVGTEQIPDSASAVDSVLDAFDRSYSYDKAGRLTTVKDRTATSGHLPDSGTAGLADGGCQTRVYAFDKNGNRTSLTSYGAAADGSCQNATGATTKTWSGHRRPDHHRLRIHVRHVRSRHHRPRRRLPVRVRADPRVLRQRRRPHHHHRDRVHRHHDHLHPGPDRATSPGDHHPRQRGAATATVVRHYTDPSDNPGWIADTTAGTTTRYAPGLGGDLAGEITTTGSTTTAALALVDLHGDITATATIPGTGNAAGIASWSDTTEYGTPRPGTTTPSDPGRYNWLGGKERAADTTGLLLMGDRLYNPVTGRFTSLDPVLGGNENAYNYPNDPVGQFDVDGRANFGRNQVAWCASTWRNASYCATYAYDDIQFAENYARTLVKKYRISWDMADAFQHVIWMALVASSVGATQARLLGEAHEADTANNNVVDRARDLANNRVGRIIGATRFHHRKSLTSLYDWVVQQAWNAWLNNQLRCTTRRRVIIC
jgi:RHS repeat-associated protein